MRFIYYFFLFLCICFAKDSNKIVEISGFQNPQAIAIAGANVYVSNAGIYKDSVKKESGFISKLDKSGKIIDLKFIDHLDYPQGLVIINNVIYIADNDTIKGFNVITKKQVLNMQIKGATSLSDIATRDNILYVSDSKAGVIYFVDINKKSYHIFVAIESSLGNPNGVAISGDFLYVSTGNSTRFGTLKGNAFRIDLETKSVYLTSSYQNSLYGIENTRQGIMIGSFDNNVVKFYKMTNDSKIFEIDLGVKLKSAMFFIYDSKSLWIPDTKQNKVFKIMP